LKGQKMDIAILREKYSALTRLIAYCEDTADWMETRVELAVEMQEEPDGFALIDHVTELLKDTRAPGPTLELVLDDLQAAADESPDLCLLRSIDTKILQLLTQAVQARASLSDQAPDKAQRELLEHVPEYARRIGMILRTEAKVAMKARERITRELEQCASVKPERLTKAERRLVEKLGKEHLTGEEIAAKLDVTYCGSFKTMLANLVKRGVLVNDCTGYHAPATSGKD